MRKQFYKKDMTSPTIMEKIILSGVSLISAVAIGGAIVANNITDENKENAPTSKSLEITDAVRTEASTIIKKYVEESNKIATQDYKERVAQPFGAGRIVQENGHNSLKPSFKIHAQDAKLHLAYPLKRDSAQLTKILEEVGKYDPQKLNATGDALAQYIEETTLDGFPAIPLPYTTQESPLVAIYNTESQRVCVTLGNDMFDCFDKDDLALNAPLAKDIQAIEAFVAKQATPAPASP